MRSDRHMLLYRKTPTTPPAGSPPPANPSTIAVVGGGPVFVTRRVLSDWARELLRDRSDDDRVTA